MGISETMGGCCPVGGSRGRLLRPWNPRGGRCCLLHAIRPRTYTHSTCPQVFNGQALQTPLPLKSFPSSLSPLLLPLCGIFFRLGHTNLSSCLLSRAHPSILSAHALLSKHTQICLLEIHQRLPDAFRMKPKQGPPRPAPAPLIFRFPVSSHSYPSLPLSTYQSLPHAFLRCCLLQETFLDYDQDGLAT